MIERDGVKEKRKKEMVYIKFGAQNKNSMILVLFQGRIIFHT